MSLKTYGNDPAFAKAAFYHPEGGADSPQKGLTKREIFAKEAMVGLASSYHKMNLISVDDVAKKSVEFADALIKALNNE